MIDWKKPLRVVNNPEYPVRLICSDAGGRWPCVCLIKEHKGDVGEWVIIRFTPEGVSGMGTRTLENVPEKLDLNGPLKTRDGLYKARVIPNSTYYPRGGSETGAMVVILTHDGDESSKAYKADGTPYYGGDGPYTLVNDVPTPAAPATKVFWANIYADDDIQIHPDKARAERVSAPTRKARVKVTYTPGQMDE